MKRVLFLALLTGACTPSTDSQTQTVPKNTHTLVFIDKTASVKPNDEFVKTKYSAGFNELVEQNLRLEGDAIEIYYIHENTPKAKVLSMVVKTPKEDLEGLSAADQALAHTNFELGISKERKKVYETLVQHLNEKNTGSSNAETNITAAARVISDALDKNQNVEVYFFSDMLESMKSGRDFHRLPPISEAQAQDWAKEDAKKFSGVNLGNADIHIVLPFPPNSSSKVNSPLISTYWRSFFETLGTNEIIEQ